MTRVLSEYDEVRWYNLGKLPPVKTCATCGGKRAFRLPFKSCGDCMRVRMNAEMKALGRAPMKQADNVPREDPD